MPNFDRSVGLDCHAGLMYVFEWPKWSEVLMDPWQALWEFDKFFGFVLETILSPLNFIICTTNNGSSPLISSILFFYIFTKHQIKFWKWMISTHYTVTQSKFLCQSKLWYGLSIQKFLWRPQWEWQVDTKLVSKFLFPQCPDIAALPTLVGAVV